MRCIKRFAEEHTMNMHCQLRFSSLALAILVALPGLVSCVSESTMIDPDAGPDSGDNIPPECRADGDKRGRDFQGKTIYVNELETEPLMFNAITSNPQAQAQLVANKLHSDTFDRSRAGANAYLIEQLTDVWSQRMFSFLVRCALSPEQSVSWQHPVTGDMHTWTGERSFCPEWHDGSIADDTACQELVSACLLATNNFYGEQVRISMRGIRKGAPLPLEEAASAGVLHDIDSVLDCPAGEPAGDASRNCGWKAEQVGTCRPGSNIQLDAADSCQGDMMVRVCDGINACDPAPDTKASTDFCAGDPLELTCPESGQFAVMSAPSKPGADGSIAVAATRAIYPVAEPQLFSVREGAFFGNIFLGPEGIDKRIGVSVEDGQVIYSFTPDATQPPNDYPIYNTKCSDIEEVNESDLRSASHAQFIAQVQDQLTEDIIVYPRLYTCSDPGWTDGYGYAAKRVCTGLSGKQMCAAKPVGPCWDSLGAQQNQCTSDDSSDRGDRDYGGCADPLGTMWQHPVTVFLDDPCSVVKESCGVRVAESVVAGIGHTCALLSNGDVRCWGSNSSGQLGHGNTDDIGDDEAAAAAGSVDIGGTATQLAAGGFHTCALLKDTGAVRCWGNNSSGRLGYGHTNHIGDGDGETPATAGDVPVGSMVKQIVAGLQHTCALRVNGAVRCWGYNADGQLGYSNTNPNIIGTHVGDDETPASAGDVLLGGTAVALAAGDSHTCALLDTGKVRCWGSVLNGRLGYGTAVQANIGDDETPASVGLDVDLGPGKAVQITAGGAHTCALLDTGSMLCWGQGSDGRLGHGTTNDIGDGETPTAFGPVNVVPPGSGTVTQVVAGGRHTCALLDSGELRCWGLGISGQLGSGSTGNIGDTAGNLPASAGNIYLGRAVSPSPAGRSLLTIAAGLEHTCAVLDTGAVRCWGSPAGGELGYGNDEETIGDTEVPAVAGDVPIY
jgi:alpha-tubulin suppressor-like RCC1 family protein